MPVFWASTASWVSDHPKLITAFRSGLRDPVSYIGDPSNEKEVRADTE